MKAATEEFLFLLLWGVDQALRPTWRNFTGSFEQWAYHNGVGRRLETLRRQELLDVRPDEDENGMAVRLTEAGRVAALSGVDPQAAWNRPWDGAWRLVMFDLPEGQNKSRVKLRRSLKKMRFGYLQNSVWISPDSFSAHEASLSGAKINVEALTLFEGRPVGGESDQDLVRGAWNFDLVTKRYAAWALVAGSVPKPQAPSEQAWEVLLAWARRERAAWAEVVDCDPFLPAALLPAGYPGRKCWAQRTALLKRIGQQLLA
ncbi:MAG: hypothetical protein ABII82_17350 [Verrucomicrobiota bacterium]